MPRFNDQRIFLKALPKTPEVLPVFRFILERPWELDKNRAKTVGFGDRSNSCFEVVLVRRRGLPLMRKRVEELRGESERRDYG